jgi:D-3-phosphoglycerate dehydrogenase
VNIEGQLLSTKGGHGYVVTDIAGVPTPDVIAALEALPVTVRLRVLR